MVCVSKIKWMRLSLVKTKIRLILAKYILSDPAKIQSENLGWGWRGRNLNDNLPKY